MKSLSEYAYDRSLTHIREHSSKASYIHSFFLNIYLARKSLTIKSTWTEELVYTEQVAPPASAKLLLTLGKMSEGQRVSKPLKGLPQSCEKPWYDPFDKLW